MHVARTFRVTTPTHTRFVSAVRVLLIINHDKTCCMCEIIAAQPNWRRDVLTPRHGWPASSCTSLNRAYTCVCVCMCVCREGKKTNERTNGKRRRKYARGLLELLVPRNESQTRRSVARRRVFCETITRGFHESRGARTGSAPRGDKAVQRPTAASGDARLMIWRCRISFSDSYSVRRSFRFSVPPACFRDRPLAAVRPA